MRTAGWGHGHTGGEGGRTLGCMAEPTVPTLPLRADVLLSNALFEELDNGISADFLRHYTGTDDLSEAEFLELQVDVVSGSQRVECIGELLPNLQQLRLNQSCIYTLRDLGTSLRQLRVLWLCRSSLHDLGGVAALPALEELYVSFNDIHELSPLCTHESLQVLDLEGNLVEDFGEVGALHTVSTLRELNLSLNPLWRREGICRERVLDALPQLEVLDDLPRSAPIAAHSRVGAEVALGPEPGLDVAALLAEAAPALLEEPPAMEDRALRELWARAGHGPVSGPGPGGPGSGSGPGPGSGLTEALREAWGARAGAVTGARPALAVTAQATPACSAVAELRAGRERLREAFSARGAAQAEALAGEPNEQDLIVERLKHAERPMPSIWRLQSQTARPADAGRRPPTSAFLDRRPLTAWSSGRPTTASSGTGTTSSRSGGRSAVVTESEAAASDLTAGDDGAPLVGNPLAVARRRRRVAAAQGEDEFSIRNLLRRLEGEALGREGGSPKAPPDTRPETPDVRVGPPRLVSSGGRNTAWAAPPRHATQFPAGAEASGTVPAPSLTTSAGEVLFIE